MKIRISKCFTLFYAIALLILVSSERVAMSQTFNFFQYDFYFYEQVDSVINSDWGLVILTTPYYAETRYLNLSVEIAGTNTRWQIRNAPIVSTLPVESEQYCCWDFDIGEIGTDVSIINYGYTITIDTVESEPVVNRQAVVESYRYNIEYGESFDSAIVNRLSMPELPSARPAVVGKLLDEAHATKEHLRNQPCLENGCTPNAISNSLMYLKNRNYSKLKYWMKDADISKDSIAKAINWSAANGTKAGWWDRKRTYLISKNIPVNTREFTKNQIDQVMNELRRGQDVEIRLCRPHVEGHTAMVTSIVKYRNDLGEFYNIDYLPTVRLFDENNPRHRKYRDKCIFSLERDYVFTKDVYTKLKDPAFIVECPADWALPIEMNYLNSHTNENVAQLFWSTTYESNNSGFEVQRMSLDIPWTAIGFVPGAGNSTEPRSYNYEDRNLASGIYHYRLKQIDFNGNYEYFELPEAVTIGVPDKFFVDQNYPNPFNPLTTIAYGIPQAGNVVLKIFDMAGREVKALVNEYKDAGYYVAKFDGSSLASGTYIYRLESGSFVSAKKMLLLK